MKFNVGEVYKNLLTHSNFGWNWLTIMGTLYKDLYTFLHMEETGSRIPSLPWLPKLSGESPSNCAVLSLPSLTGSKQQALCSHKGCWLQITMVSHRFKVEVLADAWELLCYAYISWLVFSCCGSTFIGYCPLPGKKSKHTFSSWLCL